MVRPPIVSGSTISQQLTPVEVCIEVFRGRRATRLVDRRLGIATQAIAVGWGGGAGGSSLVFSAIMRLKAIPTPSITARRTAQPIALLRIAFAPPRTARAPPVKKPPMIAFHGSSLLLQGRQYVCPVRVLSLLAPNALDSAIECRKQSSPYAEITTQDRCSDLQCCKRADASFAVRGISRTAIIRLINVVQESNDKPEALDSMPQCTSNGL